MDVSVETGKEAMSKVSAALNVAEMCFCRFGSHRIMCGCDFFQLQQRLTISYDSPAPAFWHYSVHLFLQAGAPAQTLPSSKCLVRGSLPDEIGQRGQAAHRVPAVAGAEKQCECTHHTVGMLCPAAWAEPRGFGHGHLALALRG